MPDNPRYKKGALWLTRTSIHAFLDREHSENNAFSIIPKGEYVMLLVYFLNKNYSEHISILWNEHLYYVYDVDTAYQFNIDPRHHNTKQS